MAQNTKQNFFIILGVHDAVINEVLCGEHVCLSVRMSVCLPTCDLALGTKEY